MSDWITPKEAEPILRQRARTIRERAQAGDFGDHALIRDGRRYLIRRAALEGYLRRAAA